MALHKPEVGLLEGFEGLRLRSKASPCAGPSHARIYESCYSSLAFLLPPPPALKSPAGLLEDLLHASLRPVFATSRSRSFDQRLRGIDSKLKVLALVGIRRRDTTYSLLPSFDFLILRLLHES